MRDEIRRTWFSVLKSIERKKGNGAQQKAASRAAF
jgi:hypothetical protein